MIITSKLDKKDCGCHIYHKLCSATHLPKKPTGPQPVSLATIPLVRICVYRALAASQLSIDRDHYTAEHQDRHPSLFIILALAWMLETTNERDLYVSSYIKTKVRRQMD